MLSHPDAGRPFRALASTHGIECHAQRFTRQKHPKPQGNRAKRGPVWSMSSVNTLQLTEASFPHAPAPAVPKSLYTMTGPVYGRLVAMVTLALLCWAIWTLPEDLSRDGRVVLTVMALCIAGWTMTSLGDATVAAAAAIALTILGVVDSDELYESLGHELIWILLAAFVMAAVLKASGLIEPLMFAALGQRLSVTRLFVTMTGAISATALVIPSTSGRAALLLPVFLALASHLRAPALVRALALLFPTVILLSASGSLIGAGAHILAAEILGEKTGENIGYVEWMILAMPIALASSFAACGLILFAFLNPGLRRRRVHIDFERSGPFTRRQWYVLAALAGTVGLWIAAPLHGIGLGVIALAGCLVMLKIAGPHIKSKDAFKSVEVELIVFLAATFTLAEALMDADVDEWLGETIGTAVPALVSIHPAAVIAFVAVLALAAHLIVASRTARASILIPALVLPLAETGFDITTLMMATIVGTGLCQTLSASAKPVAIFANAPIATYAPAHLLRLSVLLFPMMLALILTFAIWVWP